MHTETAGAVPGAPGDGLWPSLTFYNSPYMLSLHKHQHNSRPAKPPLETPPWFATASVVVMDIDPLPNHEEPEEGTETVDLSKNRAVVFQICSSTAVSGMRRIKCEERGP